MIGYRIKLAPDDNGTVLVTCPALPGLVTEGDTMEEARAMALMGAEAQGHVTSDGKRHAATTVARMIAA